MTGKPRPLLGGFLFLGFLDHDLAAVLEAAADGGVAAGNDLLASLHAALDLDRSVVRQAGLDAALLDGIARLDKDHALHAVAIAAGILLLVDDLEVITG